MRTSALEKGECGIQVAVGWQALEERKDKCPEVKEEIVDKDTYSFE